MVTIGLNTTTYSVCEDALSVNVTLSVQAGTLDRDVVVTLTTMNSTAMCEVRGCKDLEEEMGDRQDTGRAM